MSVSQAKGTASTHCGLLYNLFSYTMVHKPSASFILEDDSVQNQTTATAVGPLQSFCDLGTKLCNKIMNMTQTCKIKDWDTALEGNRLHKVQVTVTGEKTRSREVRRLHQGHSKLVTRRLNWKPSCFSQISGFSLFNWNVYLTSLLSTNIQLPFEQYPKANSNKTRFSNTKNIKLMINTCMMVTVEQTLF